MADLKVRDVITLTSPDGLEFTAKWAGGTRNVKKRLAMYAYAGVNGQVVDDYGSDSVTYPINIIFDGEDHRKTAKSFFDAFRERGKWRIVHPTEGILGLQGVEATERDDPITEANITRIDTQWIEYIDPISLKTLRNALLELGFAVNELEDAAGESAALGMDMSPAGIAEMKNTGGSILKSVKEAYNKAQYAISEAQEAQAEFQDRLASAVVTAAGMVSAVQNLILAPGRALRDLKARLNTMLDIINDLFGTDNDPQEPNRNDAIMREAVATSVLSCMAEGAITSSEGEENGLQSRADLLSVIETYDTLVDVIDTGTDRLMTQSDEDVPVVPGIEKPIEERYIPFEETSTQKKNIIAKTRNALREQFFKLPTERRVITKRPMSEIEIAREYFGTTGVNDEVLDRIEQANGFTSSQILLIPSGTEVRIYE